MTKFGVCWAIAKFSHKQNRITTPARLRLAKYLHLAHVEPELPPAASQNAERFLHQDILSDTHLCTKTVEPQTSMKSIPIWSRGNARLKGSKSEKSVGWQPREPSLLDEEGQV